MQIASGLGNETWQEYIQRCKVPISVITSAETKRT